jgi:hypothetical protein
MSPTKKTLKALNYDWVGKVKYDLFAFLLAFLLLFLGMLIGIIISPWFLVLCLGSPFISLLYQSQNIIEFRNIEIKVTKDALLLCHVTGSVDKIFWVELQSIEVNTKRDFAQLVSFPVKLKTFSTEYTMLFCGSEGDTQVTQFLNSCSGKTTCEFIDKKDLFVEKF